MNSYENTTSTQLTSSPMSRSTISGGRYSCHHHQDIIKPMDNKPSLIQSTTPHTKPSIAEVFNRVASKVKRSRNKDKDKQKNRKSILSASRCTVNCFNKDITPKPPSQPIQQRMTNETDDVISDPHITSKRRFTFDLGIDRRGKKKENKNKHKFNIKKPSPQTVEDVIASKGYYIEKKIADTLQGQIYRCKIIERDDNLQYFDNETVVIKVTRKDLHFEGMTILEDGKKKKIQENIIKECDILRQLTYKCDDNKHNASQYITRYIDFFENHNSYFLVMEDGGDDLFEYVVKCHNLLRKGKLQRKEWRLVCKKIFKQIIMLIDYLHAQNICHLDISLENMLIQKGLVLQNIHTGKISLSRDFTIKFCDFGLSETFKNNDFKCTKYVGKTRYKSPELWTKSKIFDARLNDIWSLGIALFMMIMGAPPLKYPDPNDENFRLIISGNILHLIQSWNRAKYMTPQILDLLQKMLTKESKRINLTEIKSHSWVKLN